VVVTCTGKVSGKRRSNVDRSRKAPVFAAVIFRRVQRRRHALRSAKQSDNRDVRRDLVVCVAFDSTKMAV
jgi:hypothetical protein